MTFTWCIKYTRMAIQANYDSFYNAKIPNFESVKNIMENQVKSSLDSKTILLADKVSFEEWQNARKNRPMKQPEVAALLFSSIDAVKSWDIGRNFINRALFNYFLLMTQQHPNMQIFVKLDSNLQANN